MGRRGLVVLLATAICVGGVATSGAASKTVAGCGPARGTTLLQGRRARVYSLPGGEPPATERVYGCLLAGDAHSWLLGPRGGPRSSSLTETMVLNAPWAGGVMRISGVDTFRLNFRARNLRSGLSNECKVGYGGFPHGATLPSVKKAVLSPGGIIAWSGYGIVHETELPPAGVQYVPSSGEPAESGYEIVECSAGRREVLDSGEQIDLSSLKLRGITLSWINAGQRKVAQLP